MKKLKEEYLAKNNILLVSRWEPILHQVRFSC